MDKRWEPVEERNRLTKKQVWELFERQDGLCPLDRGGCGQKLETKGHVPVQFIDEHVVPLSMGGTNALSNRALFCKVCAGDKTSQEAAPRAKAVRAREKHTGTGIKRKSAFQGRYRRRMDGTVIDKQTGEIVRKK